MKKEGTEQSTTGAREGPQFSFKMLEIIYYFGFLGGGASLLIFAVGLYSSFNSLFIVVTIILLISAIFLVLIGKKSEMPTLGGSRLSLVDKVIVSFIVLWSAATFVLTLGPPISRDELICHLAIPKLFVERNRIYEIPFAEFSYFPMNLEMLYMLPLYFHNDIFPKILHYTFGLLTAVVIYCYLHPLTGRTYSLLASALFISTPIVAKISPTAYIDLGVTFYITLAVVGVLMWMETKSRRKWLIYSAVSMGIALGSKYNALPACLLIGFFLVYESSRNKRDSWEWIETGSLYFILSFLPFLPWLIKNWMWTGNPLYPFPTIGAIPPLMKRSLLYKENIAQILLTPVRIFLSGKDDSLQYFDGVLNPFYLAFVPFFSKGNGRHVKILGAFATLFFLIAFLSVDLSMRYLLPVLPPLLIIMTYGIRWCIQHKYLHGVSKILLVCIFAYNTMYLVKLTMKINPFTYILGMETKEEYLMSTLSDYPVINFANTNLPHGSKILLLFTGDRGYYWEREYMYFGRDGRGFKEILENASSRKDLFERFQAYGISHICVRDPLLNYYVQETFDAKTRKILNDMFADDLILLYKKNDYSLYEMRK